MPVVLSIKKFLQPKLRLCVFDVHHRYIVFTIPSEYRFLFRKDRKALNLLFVAARNTISLLFNKKIYSKIIKDKKVNPKDNYCLLRNYKHKIEFRMIASLHTFGRALNWNPHIHWKLHTILVLTPANAILFSVLKLFVNTGNMKSTD